MGKISSALEKHRTENIINTEPLYYQKPTSNSSEMRKAVLIRDNAVGHKYDPKLVVITAPDSADAERFKLLRAQILFGKNRQSPRTILVASALPGEGKTFVAANLAASIALGIEEYVLLVDCDLRRPSLHGLLGYRNSEGLREHLTDGKALQDLIISTRIDKLSLLPAGHVPTNPAELLSSTMMEAFLEEVKGRYSDRLIVVDSTPCQAAAEAAVLAQHVDAIVLVVSADRTPRKAIQNAVHTLGKEKIIGVVFNGFTQASSHNQSYYPKLSKVA